MYTVAIKIEEMQRRRRSASVMHAVIGFFLLAKAADYYRLLQFESFLPPLPAFLIAGVSIAYSFLRKTYDPLARYHHSLRILQLLTFLYLGVAFLKMATTLDSISVFAFALLCLLLYFVEKKIFSPTQMVFTKDGVTVPGGFKNHLVSWADLSEVVVREDFITLFHVQKKYLQYQVMQDLSTLEVAKMNAFCKEQIEALKVLPERREER